MEAELKALTNVLSISLDFSTTVIGNKRIHESVREGISITIEIKNLFDISTKKVSVIESTLRKADNQIGEKFLRR